MEWELVKLWVNRVGIVLEFLSFWLAAPEILGEERLRKLERRLERGVRWLPLMIILLYLGLTLLVGKGGMRLLEELQELASMATAVVAWQVVMAASLTLVMILVMIILSPGRSLRSLTNREVVVLAILWLVMLGTLVDQIRLVQRGFPPEELIGAHLFVALGAMWWIALDMVQSKVVPYLLRVMADDQRIRQRSLAVGAVLFVVGFLLQLIATF